MDYYGQELGLGSVGDLGLFLGGVYSPFRPFALSNVGYDCANRHDLTIAIRDRKLNREIGVDTVVQFSLLLLLYRLPGFQNGLIVRPKILGLFVGEEFTGCLALGLLFGHAKQLLGLTIDQDTAPFNVLDVNGNCPRRWSPCRSRCRARRGTARRAPP